MARLLRCRIDVMAPRINRHGPAHVAAMRRGLEDWLRWNKMESLDDMNGIVSLETTRDPAAFERAHYIRTLHSWTK